MPNGLPYARTRSHIPRTTPVGGDVVDGLQDSVVALWASGGALGSLGDGSDGTVTLDGVVAAPAWATAFTIIGAPTRHQYRMNRDIYLDGGGILVTGVGTELWTNGYRIYSRGKVRTAAGGIIHNNGNDADLVSVAAGAAGNNGTMLGGAAGGAGGNGGLAGNAGQPSLQTIYSSGAGAGGAGGAGNAHAGAAGGNVAFNIATASQNPGLRMYSPHLFGYLVGAGFGTPFNGDVCTITPIMGGAGGGGGGDNGGGGGAGGGPLAIAALEIQLAHASDLQSHGGKGGPGLGANSGGGGGGSGGPILLATCLLTIDDGSVLSAAVNCAGGALGVHTGAGVDGAAGANGDFRLNVLRAPFTPAASAAIVPSLLPDIYADGTEPDPATMPLRAVICITYGPDNQALFINRDGTKWSALG
jgi:hypothetical protein